MVKKKFKLFSFQNFSLYILASKITGKVIKISLATEFSVTTLVQCENNFCIVLQSSRTLLDPKYGLQSHVD